MHWSYQTCLANKHACIKNLGYDVLYGFFLPDTNKD